MKHTICGILYVILLCHIIWSFWYILSLQNAFHLASESGPKWTVIWVKMDDLLSWYLVYIWSMPVRCQSFKRLIIIRFWRYIFASFKANKIQRINTRNNKTKTTNCENSTYKSGKFRQSTVDNMSFISNLGRHITLFSSANRAAAQVHSCLYLSSFTIYISDNSKKFLKTTTWKLWGTWTLTVVFETFSGNISSIHMTHMIWGILYPACYIRHLLFVLYDT